ncbi:MAG: hypothetical protein P1U83_18460 [Roseovarius sp.]|nr:hypothetical protein [Roseovarius sp.]
MFKYLTKNTKHCFSRTLHLLLSSLIVVLSTVSDARSQNISVEVETRILPTDLFPGMKSRHPITINFDNETVEQINPQTGVTDFKELGNAVGMDLTELEKYLLDSFGIDLEAESIRDTFEVREVSFDGDVVHFAAIGETASAVQVLPNINYRFEFSVTRDGRANVAGCHDGYPAYSVTVGGETQYAYRHLPDGGFGYEIGRLVGSCDIRVTDENGTTETPLAIESSAIIPIGAGSGLIEFEASSTHAAIQLTYENPLSNRTEWVIFAIAPDQSRQSATYMRRGFAQIIADFGRIGTTGAALVNQQFTSQLQQTDLPPADFRFSVRADSSDLAVVDIALREKLPTISKDLETSDYLTISRSMANLLQTAVLSAPNRALEVQINSAGDRMNAPPVDEKTTALSWLFEYALQGEFSNAMAGCGETTGEDEMQLLAALQEGLDNPRTTGRNAVALEVFRWFVSEIADATDLDLPMPGPFALMRSSMQADRYAEFMLMGHIDPARLNVLACKAQRRLRGMVDPVEHVIERSEIYRVASEEIGQARSGPAPKFFDAARAVTRLVGVGMVDLATDMQIDNSTYTVAFAGYLADMSSCLGSEEGLLPNPIDRSFLRAVNAELLAFNTPRIRRLIDAPSIWFDPVTLGALNPPEDMNPALWFDLRMVQAEQGLVETLVRKERILPGSERDQALTRAELAMRCLTVSKLVNFFEQPGPASAHLELIRDMDSALTGLIKEDLLVADEQRFTNRDWRIAIGSAFVFALHRQDSLDAEEWLDDFVRYIRLLRQAPQAYLPGVPRAVQNRINGVIRSADDRWSEGQIGALSDATQLYLSNSVDAGLFRCDQEPNGLAVTVPYPVLASPTDRVTRLSEVGIGAIALPFELVSEGGALAPSLLSSPVNDPQTFCEALERRHHALACAVASQRPSGDCSEGALRLADRDDGATRFLFMEPTISLREDLSHLGPFLLRELQALGPNMTSAELDEAVRRAVQSHVDYSVALALSALMEEQTMAVRRVLSVSTTDEYWENLLEQALPPEAGDLVQNGAVDEEAVAEMAEALSLDRQIMRLEQVENDLLAGVLPLLEPSLGTNLSETESGETSGQSADNDEPQDFLSVVTLAPGETGLGFEMNELGIDSDGATLHTATLVYRRAATGAVASVECTDCPVGGGKHSDQSGRLPLGIELGPVAIGPDGAVTLRGGVGVPLVRYYPEQTRAALHALGMPRAISLGGISLNFDAALGDVQLDVDLGMAGLTGLVVRIPVILEGEMVDFENAAQIAIESAVAEWLASRAADLSFDVNLSASETLPIRLAMEPGSLKPRVDWSGGSVTASATLALYVGSEELEQRFDASAQLVFSSDGVQILSLSFDAEDPDRLAQAVLTIPPFNSLAAYADRLLVLPEFVDGKFTLLVRAVVIVEGCEASIEQRIDPTEIGDALDMLKDQLATSGAQLATCTLSKSLGSNLSRLTGGEVDLFGVNVAFDFENMRQGDDLAIGQVTVPISFPADQFSECDAPVRARIQPLERLIFDLRPEEDSFGIDFSELTENERKSLGSALQCRLAADLDALSGTFRVTNMEVGRDLIAADVTLIGLPFLGDLVLPRINLLDLDLDLGAIFEAAIKARAETELVAYTKELVGDELDLAGVGSFRPDWEAARFDLFEAREISLEGQLSINENLSLKIKLILPLQRDTVSGFRIEVEDGAAEAVLNNLGGMLIGMLPFPDGLQITNPRFSRLDDAGYRWGMVFGAEAKFSVGDYGISVAIRRVAVSAEGVELDQQIRMGLDTALVLGPVTLSRILVIYNTGADGGSKGLTLGTDITMLAPMVANILKIEALLDLRDADIPRFVLEGDLIAFGSLALLESQGVIDLGENQLVSFEAATTDAIRDVIDAAADGLIDGRNALVRAETKIAVLGVDLQQSRMEFCTSACNETFPNGGSATLSVADNLPFGPSTRIDFQSDLEFRDPSLGAGVALDLFGWKPGSAGMSANLEQVRVELSFLGIDVGITTPTMELMSPQYITDVLLSLLDIDLEALMRLPPDKIEITLMQGDGSTSTTAGGEGSEADDGSDAQEGDREPVAPGTAAGPPPTFDPGPQEAGAEENPTGPSQPMWGTTVEAIFCEEVGSLDPANSPGDHPARSIDAGDRYQIWPLWRGSGGDLESPLFNGHPHQLPTYHGPTFSAAMASSICNLSGKQLLLEPLNVGVARDTRVSSPTCEDSVPGFDYYRLDPGNPDHLSRFANAQRSVLCFETSYGRFDVEARLLWRQAQEKYVAVLFCPSINNVDALSELRAMPGYLDACGDDVKPIELASTTNCTSDCTRISDIEDRNLIDGQLRPILLSGQGQYRPDQPIDEGTFEFGGATVQLRQIAVSGVDGQVKWHRFELGIETNEPGISRIVDLRLPMPSDVTAGLWPWMQPENAMMRNYLLQRWLASGRRPVVMASFPDEGWLVLRGLGADASEVRGKQDWLKDNDALAPLLITLDASWQPPAGGTGSKSEQLNIWMEGLRELMPHLIPHDNEWILEVGIAPNSKLVLYGFSAVSPQVQGTDLILHLHAYDRTLTAPWLGGLAEPTRTFCTTKAEAIAALRFEATPERVGFVDLTALLSNPDELSVEAGLRRHAFSIINEMEVCE